MFLKKRNGFEAGNIVKWFKLGRCNKARLLKTFIYLLVCVCTCTWEPVCHICAGACSGQTRVLDLLKLEFQVVVSCQMWVVGTWVLWRSRKYS